MKKMYAMCKAGYKRVKSARTLQKYLLALADNTLHDLALMLLPPRESWPDIEVPTGLTFVPVRQALEGKLKFDFAQGHYVVKNVYGWGFTQAEGDWLLHAQCMERQLRDAGYDGGPLTWSNMWTASCFNKWVADCMQGHINSNICHDPSTRTWKCTDVPMVLCFQTSQRRQDMIRQLACFSAEKLAWMCALSRAINF